MRGSGSVTGLTLHRLPPAHVHQRLLARGRAGFQVRESEGPSLQNFPDASDPVNGFLPKVMVTLDEADAAIVRNLTRPTREDHLRGQYGGLAALHVREQIRAGTVPEWTQALWPRLVKLVPELAL